ncbi:hypothetical protein CYLTODRAFT_443062 [Cylindrobasidium torrendii FP15055 ss-10]|uniref:EthD domain-containing protein n=1 Tax=Cylindrobasidium torrendii FP15055 ss-10 TaxID=1314674 RepID=A0A0D7BFK8_9AGAR|nr:hypothetical protein CYLTODRAFT_443062 [Cylindrobasidium torrendii FP15055 ss-10]
MATAATTLPPKSERARLLVLVKRKAGTTKEEFCEYWWKQHSPTMFAHIPEPSFRRFDQMHVNDEINAQLAKFGAKTTNQWDGIALIEAASWEELFKIMNDTEYAKIREEDEARFADRAETLLIPVVNINFLDN